jgi:hypothetical protein
MANGLPPDVAIVASVRKEGLTVVVACLGYSRAGAGAVVFSKEAPDVLWRMSRCLWSLGGLP